MTGVFEIEMPLSSLAAANRLCFCNYSYSFFSESCSVGQLWSTSFNLIATPTAKWDKSSVSPGGSNVAACVLRHFAV
jgi:hypothetical protein